MGIPFSDVKILYSKKIGDVEDQIRTAGADGWQLAGPVQYSVGAYGTSTGGNSWSWFVATLVKND